jgi:nitroimidazol reductase NimA-like FMN-containing flavoprotein (pyridoxamine 5'-phosphate oxidase superfamily)
MIDDAWGRLRPREEASVPADDLAFDGSQLRVLGRDDCLELLTKHRFLGRIGVVVAGRPLIFPVNYIADAESIVFCTAPGTKFDAVRRGADVVFEIDNHDPLHHSGWSVLVKGRSQAVTDKSELARLRTGRLRPWVRGARINWIRIRIDEISGRRLPDY